MPARAARSDLHCVQQQRCALREALSRVLPPGLVGAPELGLAGHIRTCSVHHIRAAPMGCRISRLSRQRAEWGALHGFCKG